MLPERQPMPKLARLINRAADAFLGGKDPLLGVDREALMESVSRRLALDDFGDGYFMEGFERLIDSLKHDTDLTFLGKVLQRTALERCLENRLRFAAYRKKRPDVFAEKLNRPIIVLGFPRSGTTFLHRLLAQDPGNRALYFWELVHPIPPLAGGDYRARVARVEYGVFHNLSINMDHIHVIRDTEYEECIWLLATTFQSSAYWVTAPVYSYAKWCLETDRSRSYAEYHQLLKIYQAQTPEKRLTLKAPAHTGALVEIRRHIPDAIIVQTHRHPVDVCNSSNSLMYWAHCNMANRLDVRRMCRLNMDMLDYDMKRNLFCRKHHGVRVHDIMYDQLLADPMAAVKGLYQAHCLELSEAAEAAMEAFIRRNPQNKHGKHTYRAADFGMTEKEITDRFDYYMDQFGFPQR